MPSPTIQPNLGFDRSLAIFDHPQRFVASWVYNLPFGDTVLHTDNKILKSNHLRMGDYRYCYL